MSIKHISQSLSAAVISIGLVVLAFGGGIVMVSLVHLQIKEPVAHTATFPAPITLDEAALKAKAAIVYDPTNGRILYAKNAQKQLPLASLTKLMTAEVVLGQMAANTSVQITKKDLDADGDLGLRAGDTLSLFDLLKLGLVASSNDAMAAAAASLGSNYLTAMNDMANKLGLTKTYFLNPTGLDLSRDSAGAYGSAYDVARLAATFYKEYPDYFSLTTNRKVTVQSGTRTLSAVATALPLSSLPGFIGAKTGYTDLAGGNLVVIFDIEIGHPLVAVVLGSTEQGRFDDIRTLAHAIRTNESQ